MAFWNARVARRIVLVLGAAVGTVTAWGKTSVDSWEPLDTFQGRCAAEDLRERLARVYAPYAGWDQWIQITPEAAWIRVHASQPYFYYRLGLNQGRGEDDPQLDDALLGKPFEDWVIAIDPGHIGGEWGPLEQRSFRIGDQPVVQEGDLVLAAARRLLRGLASHGVSAVLVRDSPQPVTALRPADFRAQAQRELTAGPNDSPSDDAIRRRAELLFYRQSEIQARAKRVNEEIRPDLVIALHIDATAWEDPARPALLSKNGGHIIVNGGFMEGELQNEEMRRAMVLRLLKGYDRIEIPIAVAIAEAMVRHTGLPPATYRGENAAMVEGNPYIWARNLMANRTYDAPVVYLEPWTLNSLEVYPWAALGDYDGEQEVNGQMRASLPAIYAAFVLEGLLTALKREEDSASEIDESLR